MQLNLPDLIYTYLTFDLERCYESIPINREHPESVLHALLWIMHMKKYAGFVVSLDHPEYPKVFAVTGIASPTLNTNAI